MALAAHRWLMTAPKAPMVQSGFDPFPPAAGEVVVQVAGCGVCHTDLGYFYDGVRLNHPLPLALGHEVAGRVVAAGDGAEELDRARGDRPGGDPVRRVRAVPARPAEHLPPAEDARQ